MRASASQMRRVRGADMAMIFQEPMTSLNPVFTVGEQIAESIRLHQGKSHQQAQAEARRMLDLVHSGSAQCAVALSASALRRYAPARDDRHGAVVQASAADCR